MGKPVKCPACKKAGDWLAEPWSPFCSRRCKLIDLGKWFSEEHAISEPLKPGHLEEGIESISSEDLDKPDGGKEP